VHHTVRQEKTVVDTIFTIHLAFAAPDGFQFISGVKQGWASYFPGL